MLDFGGSAGAILSSESESRRWFQSNQERWENAGVGVSPDLRWTAFHETGFSVDAASWRKVLESIRPEDQTSVIVRTVDAMEVAVESLARIEEEVVLIKGRLSGAPDGRRLFVFPYDKLSCLYVNRVVANDEIDLFSPTVAASEKDKISMRVSERLKLAGEQAQEAGATKLSDSTVDLRSQLEELRRLSKSPASPMPGPAAPPPAAGPTPGGQVVIPAASPKQVESASKGKTLSIPAPPERRPGTKFTLPEMPNKNRDQAPGTNGQPETKQEESSVAG